MTSSEMPSIEHIHPIAALGDQADTEVDTEDEAGETFGGENRSRDEQPRAIAERYAATLTEEDRHLGDPKAVRVILELLHDALRATPTDLLSSAEHLGNLPATIGRAIYDNKKDEAIAALEAWSQQDPITNAAETATLRRVTETFLPPSIQKALSAISLQEGGTTIGNEFQELARRIGAAPEGVDLVNIVRAQRGEAIVRLNEADELRQAAVCQFLEMTYPEVVAGADVALLKDIWALTPAERNDKKRAEAVVERYQALVGDRLFSKRYRGLGIDKNAAEVLDRLRHGRILGPEVSLVAGAIEEELIRYTSERIGVSA